MYKHGVYGAMKETFVHLLVFTCMSLLQSSGGAAYLARHVALKSDVPVPVPALTVNRLCGSGFQSIVSGAQVYSGTSDKRQPLYKDTCCGTMLIL